MATITPIKALNNYFNVEPRKVGMTAFAAEIKALTPKDKLDLVTGVLAITGDTLSDSDMEKLIAAAA